LPSHHSHRHSRRLRSFPTRRSSDLARPRTHDAGAVLGRHREGARVLRADARPQGPPQAGGAGRPLVRRALDGHVERLRGRHRGGRDGGASRRGDLRSPRPAGQPLLAGGGFREVTAGPSRPRVDRDALAPLPVDVVSVQSQVVYGCVGNSVAAPTLQALGLNVVAVPTVLLSNVPHYDTLHGGAVPTDWFAGFLADLERRRALESARAVLVGYLGPPEQTAVLVEWLERVLARYPQLRLVVDPVIGDRDVGVYVHPDVPRLLRDALVPMAHGIAPNSFEFEQVVGRPVPTYR